MSPPGAPGEAANGTNTGARGRVPGDRSATVLVGAPVPVPVPLALYVALYVALSVALYVSVPVAVPEEPSPCPVP
ncbi:hypothetical protein SAMN05216260_12649 [Streptomyces griseoaurantiacus]|uniref:Uncharacterized protein n=1 Tax=Streptomyces griseoaurantiacus TaxID=68213 RepID=A0A1G7WDC9_9ACTN|nr:hypothetical protein SAMN05216260_12649 [Streptomyces jietaisiensis]